jgi:hypothetical protein
MTTRLILLAAALLCWAAPASAQTIKSLGYNSTNGNIVSATNVTFTNSVGFATNARASTRTNLGGTTVGNSVFTATNAAAAATAIGLGTTNDVTFGSITTANGGSITLSGAEGDASVFIRNNAGDLGLYGDVNIIAHKAIIFTNSSDASLTRENLGLPLAALTNTSNVTTMRALAGSTNTNEPYSGTVALTNTNVLTFSNGVLLKIQ